MWPLTSNSVPPDTNMSVLLLSISLALLDSGSKENVNILDGYSKKPLKR